jgi:large subunit ribosomal protein L29e
MEVRKNSPDGIWSYRGGFGRHSMAKRSNTSAHNRSHQQHRNGIKRADNVQLWFPKGMNVKFLRNVKAAKKGIARKTKGGGGSDDE